MNERDRSRGRNAAFSTASGWLKDPASFRELGWYSGLVIASSNAVILWRRNYLSVYLFEDFSSTNQPYLNTNSLCNQSLPSPSSSSSPSSPVSVSSQSLNIFYFNARSILPKFHELYSLCSLYNPDLVCIVESWLSSDISDNEILIPNYSIFRLDRSRHGGGILVYVKSSLCVSSVQSPLDIELLFLTVKSNHRSFSIATFYRHCWLDLHAHYSFLSPYYSIPVFLTFSPIILNIVSYYSQVKWSVQDQKYTLSKCWRRFAENKMEDCYCCPSKATQ